MEPPTEHCQLIADYQARLDAAASVRSRDWWERYLRGVIPFRGVGLPDNLKLLKAWRAERGLDAWPAERELDLACALFEGRCAEDKLAGVLYLQHYLVGRADWRVMLARVEDLFARRLIFDWSLTDWLCMRVLAPLIEHHGKPCAQAVLAWRDAEYLWRARASLVPFASHAGNSAYRPGIRRAARLLIRREERFAKTAVGWVLREISKYDLEYVRAFIDAELGYFSREALANALKYRPQRERKAYFARLSRR